jgi:hypothetical protein
MRLLLVRPVSVFLLLVSAYAQIRTGAVVIYRAQGKNFLFAHYAQGEHPTVVCDDIKIAKLAEKRKTTVVMPIGGHTCSADEKQYPGELDASSTPVEIIVKQNGTAYLRVESHVGHVAFVLRQVSPEIGSTEIARMKAVKDEDSYTTVLPSAIKQVSK